MSELEKNIRYDLIRVNWNCNLYCLFCNVPKEDHKDRKEPSYEEVKKEIDNLLSRKDRVRISISGGEPTLREDLPDIIRYAKESGVASVQLQTNAIKCVDKSLVEKLNKAGLDKVFVGFHSHFPDIYNKLVGGGYKKAIEGIQNLENYFEVILNPVVTNYNYKKLPEFVDFIADNFKSVKFISLSTVQPRGRARNKGDLVPDYRKIDPYIKKALKRGEKRDLVINNPYCGLPLCVGEWWKKLHRSVEASENYLKGDTKNSFNECMKKTTEKIKNPKCFLCDVGEFCEGIWKEYEEIYSLDFLKPIKLTKVQKRKLVNKLEEKNDF